MRLSFRSIVLTGLCAAVLASAVPCANAADKETKPAATTKGAKGKPAKARGRLPANYAKLGLAADQREKIYDIQIKYNAQISELEKQLVDLRGKRDTEIEGVLNASQKTKLTQIQQEAKAKPRKKPGTETKPEQPKKPAATTTTQTKKPESK